MNETIETVSAEEPVTEPTPAACCDASEQAVCCEPSEQASCCSPEAAAAGECGCR